jgi:hypothetical protein
VLGERLAARVGRVDRGALVGTHDFAHAGVRIRVEVVLPIDVGELLGVGRLCDGVGAGVARELRGELAVGLRGVGGLRASRPGPLPAAARSSSLSMPSSSTGFSCSSCCTRSTSSMRESWSSLIACCSCGVITSC